VICWGLETDGHRIASEGGGLALDEAGCGRVWACGWLVAGLQARAEGAAGQGGTRAGTAGHEPSCGCLLNYCPGPTAPLGRVCSPRVRRLPAGSDPAAVIRIQKESIVCWAIRILHIFFVFF
jgi:hypothetical protein